MNEYKHEFIGDCDIPEATGYDKTENRSENTHREYASLRFKSIMETNDEIFSGPQTVKTLKMSLDEAGDGESLTQLLNVQVGHDSKQTRKLSIETSSPTLRFKQDEEGEVSTNAGRGQEAPALAIGTPISPAGFLISAKIIHSDCIDSPVVQGPCTTEMPAGCYEIWTIKASPIQVFGVVTEMVYEGYRQREEKGAFGVWNTTVLTDAVGDCEINYDDMLQEVGHATPTFDLHLSSYAIVNGGANPCFLSEVRRPSFVYNHRLFPYEPSQSLSCWDSDPKNNCFGSFEFGRCLNLSGGNGGNSGYDVEATGEFAHMGQRLTGINAGNISGSNTDLSDASCGRGSPCSGDGDDTAGNTGCVDWFFGAHMTLMTPLPSCAVFFGDGSFSVIEAEGSDGVDDVGCNGARDRSCIRDSSQSGCPTYEPESIVSPGTRMGSVNVEYSGRAGVGFQITRFEEIAERPSREEFENL
tara:strand:+ start:77 stop:1483 length:1407 start_codon:yes stop_codon:yes gene_type:complete